jgi:hypothetical protein
MQNNLTILFHAVGGSAVDMAVDIQARVRSHFLCSPVMCPHTSKVTSLKPRTTKTRRTGIIPLRFELCSPGEKTLGNSPNFLLHSFFYLLIFYQR